MPRLDALDHAFVIRRLPDGPHLLDVEPHHLGAVVRHVLGKTQRLELADGLANRRDAHAELAGEILEPQGRPRRELAHDDRLAQALERRLGHRPMADGGSSADWQRRLQRADPEAHLIRCQTRERIAARRVAA